VVKTSFQICVGGAHRLGGDTQPFAQLQDHDLEQEVLRALEQRAAGPSVRKVE
jgi:hypothetical protein